MSSSVEQLEVLFPEGKKLTIQGEDLIFKPFKAGKLAAVMRAVDPISNVIFGALQSGESHMKIMTKLFAEGGEHILDLAALGSNKTRAWVDELEMDELLKVVTATIEVNLDFFVRQVLPSLKGTMAGLIPTNLSGQTQ